MGHCQTLPMCEKPLQPKSRVAFLPPNGNPRQAKDEVESTLRDIAFVLRMTERVRGSMKTA